LTQGYSIKELLNPIVRDLLFVGKEVRQPSKNFFKKNNGFTQLVYRRGIIKGFIIKFFLIYKRLYFKFFVLNDTWFNYYLV
jgi:hypothetical protein